MNIERLRKIIEYSHANRENMEMKLNEFYNFAGMNNCQEMRNIMQIVKVSFFNKGFLVLEIPFADKEIGALCYKGDAIGYIVINTSLPKVNVNFSICHEIYHVFFQKSEFKSKVELVNDHYYEHEDEFSANLFAGMLLMPETSFRFMYNKFLLESHGERLDCIVKLMNYYQAPYMAVFIRCLELELLETTVSEELINMSYDKIREKFIELWLDESVLDATKKDDYAHIETIVQQLGNEYIRDSYLTERTLKKVLQNMKVLYQNIKEK